MTQKLNIELDDKVFQQLKKVCKGDESAMREYIVQTLKENFNQNDSTQSPKDKEDLESYLNKGQPGSRTYGIKGQGW